MPNQRRKTCSGRFVLFGPRNYVLEALRRSIHQHIMAGLRRLSNDDQFATKGKSYEVLLVVRDCVLENCRLQNTCSI